MKKLRGLLFALLAAVAATGCLATSGDLEGIRAVLNTDDARIKAAAADATKANEGLKVLETEVAKKANEADVARRLEAQRLETARLHVEAANALKRVEAATDTDRVAAGVVREQTNRNTAAIRNVREGLRKTDQTVAEMGASINNRLTKLEGKVTGVRRVEERVWALLEKAGFDQTDQAVIIGPFPPRSSVLTGGIKRRLDDIAAAVKKLAGKWKVGSIVGFPDDNPATGLMLATSRARSGTDYLKNKGLGGIPAVGREAPMFGRVNAAGRIIVFFVRPAAPAAAAPPAAAPPAPTRTPSAPAAPAPQPPMLFP